MALLQSLYMFISPTGLDSVEVGTDFSRYEGTVAWFLNLNEMAEEHPNFLTARKHERE